MPKVSFYQGGVDSKGQVPIQCQFPRNKVQWWGSNFMPCCRKPKGRGKERKYPVTHPMESAFMFLKVMLACGWKGVSAHRWEVKLGEMVAPFTLTGAGQMADGTWQHPVLRAFVTYQWWAWRDMCEVAINLRGMFSTISWKGGIAYETLRRWSTDECSKKGRASWIISKALRAFPNVPCLSRNLRNNWSRATALFVMEPNDTQETNFTSWPHLSIVPR